MFALTNCDVFCGTDVISDHAILIHEDRIADLVPLTNLPSGIESVDLRGASVAPGFVDLQVNGGGGVLVDCHISDLGLRSISAAHRKYGTTSFLPALISSSSDDARCVINAVSRAMSNPELGILGLHMEGPYLNPDKAGVHDKQQTRRATADEVQWLVDLGRNTVRLMTAAPEMLDKDALRFLQESGWRLSIGHSNDRYATTMDALAQGFTCVTHLFNAMSQFGSREPGIVGAAFDSRSGYASIIVDGFHVDYAAVRVAKKIMRDRLFLVTDAMPPVGSDDDHFTLGQYKVERAAGKLATSDGVLAGSCLDMASAVRNSIQQAGITMPEALRMASWYPAKVLGIDHEYGLVKKGYKADLVIFNNQIHVLGTIKNGNVAMH